jgi:large repetitive protein
MKNSTFILNKHFLLITLLIFYGASAFAQNPPPCGLDVPLFNIDFTGTPDAVWVSPEHVRKGLCCGSASNEVCTSFKIKLDPSTIAIKIDIISGAISGGALYYQTSCGTKYPIGEEICFSGVGPHFISFCKPGNNANVYKITSLSMPTFPVDQTIVDGCSKKMVVYGLDTASVKWSSIFPGNLGEYNGYLSCTTNCTDPSVTPDSNAPAYVDYLVCGLPAAEGCGFSGMLCDTVRVHFLPEIEITLNPSNNVVFCDNKSGVQLSASATGGSGNYSFSWTDSNGNIVSNAAGYYATGSGNYSISVKDLLPGEQCVKTEVVKVAKISKIFANAGQDILMCEKSPQAVLNGSVTENLPATWTGGNGTFSPSNKDMNATYNPTLAEINAGQVKLILKPDNSVSGCGGVNDTVLLSFSKVPVVEIVHNGIKCFGEETNLTAQVNGGFGVLAYFWNTGVTASQIIGGAGNYSVKVTDELGCEAAQNISIQQPELLMVTAESNPAYCGLDNGQILTSVNGGTIPYKYLWSNGTNLQSANDLAKGEYELTVIDINGCTEQLNAVVYEIEAVDYSAEIQNVTCNGLSNGSISLEVSGGIQPYIIAWDNGDNGLVNEALGKGQYGFTVTDEMGCEVNGIFSVTEPNPLVVELEIDGDIKCHGEKINIISSANGGTGMFTYLWNNSETSENINANAGSYSVTVTDEAGCTESANINISEPELLIAKAEITPLKCSKNNGEVTIITSGGTIPYSYNWSNGHNAEDAKDLAEGTYTIKVMDANGCSVDLQAEVKKLPVLSMQSNIQQISCFGQSDGLIDIMITEGSGPFIFDWSNGSSKAGISGLKAGSYSVTITDYYGCNSQEVFQINQPAIMKNEFEFSIYSNTFNLSSPGSNDGYIKSIVSGGTAPYTYEWAHSANSSELNNLSAGVYQVKITDSNGCTITENITLNEPSDIIIPNGFSPNSDGDNDAFVIKGIEGNMNNTLMVFNRWGTEVFSQKNYSNNWTGLSNNGSQLLDGTYFIIFKITQNNTENIFKTYVELKR